MKKNLQLLWLLTLIALFGCSSQVTSPPTPEPDHVKFQLSWQHGVQFLGFYAAEAQGYYAAENLAVEIIPLVDATTGNTIPQLVVDGELDFSSSASTLVNAQAEGLPITAFGTILHLSPVTFFAKADSGIETPEDFAGRRIVVKTEGWRDTLEIFLSKGNLMLDDVEAMPGGFDMTPFYEDDIEIWGGFLTNEVILARQQGLDLVTFPLYEYDIEVTPFNLYTRQDLIETQPELATRFLNATMKGWDWAIEHPVEAVDMMIEQFPDLAEQREFHLASFDTYIAIIKQAALPIGAIDCERWLTEPEFGRLDSTENLCTTEIYEALNKD